MPQPIRYPPAREDDVVEIVHGESIADPYRWMEDLESPQLAAWIAAQNAVTSRYLALLPLRDALARRIGELWNYAKTTLPVVRAGRIFYQKNRGLEKQAAIYMRDGFDDPPQLILDPNALSADGATALMAFAPSPDARLLAYTLSDAGADWQTIHVRDLATGADLPDLVRWMRFSELAWTNDSAGFFYSRYPEPPAGKIYEAALSGHALYYHRVGTPQADDLLIYERPDLSTWFVSGTVTEDGRYLLISLAEGATNSNRLYYADLGDGANPRVEATVQPLSERDGAEFAPVGSRGHLLLVRTDAEAPNRKIVAFDLRASTTPSRTIVQDRPDATLDAVALAGERLYAEYLVDVQSRISIVDPDDGHNLGEVALPGPGVVAGFQGRQGDARLWLTWTSPLQPVTVFAFEPETGALRPFEAAQPPVDLSRFETRQLFAASRDGTRIPFFLTSRIGLARDGSAPAMLYGYGGFSVNLLPAYRPDVPAWLELGGLWITVNTRGGAEYGEAWHRAGMGPLKQNVFHDFLAVAECLIEQGYTSPAHMGVMGGSNGGLLVGAMMTQRPELFAVALPAVGVLDMLRYDRFTGGRAWVIEYGSPSDPVLSKVLLGYSPLHKIRPDTCYPATLVTTADRDDRVVPSHSFKFAAALQRAQGCGRPVLIRVETHGSHGYRPTDRRIEELADQWAFAAANMGIDGAAGERNPDAVAGESGSRPSG
jgi:prolyl oligopeptidase